MTKTWKILIALLVALGLGGLLAAAAAARE